MNVNVIKGREEEEDFDLEESADYTTHEIVKQDTLPLKTLTNEEAVMKMDLSKDMFMIFKNEADQKIKVIYRRDDGNYGIIEPHM
jgi:putative sigma-54 modulation protein